MRSLLKALSVLVLLLTLLLLAVFTEHGARGLLGAMETLFPLQVEYGGGKLSGQLTIHRLRYETDNLHLELNEVVSELNLSCLWRSTFCFQQLQAASLDIEILPERPEDRDLPQEQEADEQLVFPVDLEASELRLQSVRIRWAGGAWQQGSTEAHVRVHESDIEVVSALIVDSRLTLKEITRAADSPAQIENMPVISLPFFLQVDDLQLVNPVWELYGSAYHQDTISLSGQWEGSSLRLEKFQADEASLGELFLGGDIDFSGNWPLQATARINLVQPPLSPVLSGQYIALSAKGNLSEVSFELTSAGEIELAAVGQVDVLEAGMPFSANLTATSDAVFQLSDLEGIPDFLASVEIELPLSVSAQGSMTLQNFEVRGVASGLGYESVQFFAEGQNEDGTVELIDLSIRDEAQVNELRGSGRFRMGEVIEWNLALASNGLNIPPVNESVRGRLFGSLELSGKQQEHRWQVAVQNIAVQGEVNGLPAHIVGFAAIDSKMHLSKSDLRAELNGANFSLQVDESDSSQSKLKLDIEDLGRWHPDARGFIHLEGAVSADRDRVQLHGKLQDIFWQGAGVHSGTVVAEYRADANRSFQLDTRLNAVRLNDIEIEVLQLLAQGDETSQTLSLASQGAVEAELTVNGGALGDQWRGVLEPMRLKTAVGEWRLPDSVALRWSAPQQQMSVEGHCWQHEDAELCFGDSLLGRQGSSSLDIAGDIGPLVARLWPDLSLGGELKSRLEARWNPSLGVTAAGRFSARQLTVAQLSGEGEAVAFGWDTGEGSFEYGGEGLQLILGLKAKNQEVMNVNLLLPTDRSAAIAGSVVLEDIQLAAFAPLLSAFSTLDGEINGQLSIAGTVDEPLIQGAMYLADGHLVIAGNPTELKRLNLAFLFDGDSARVSGSGILGEGEIALAGEFITTPEVSLVLSVNGQNNSILYPPSTELQVSENLQLTISRERISIEGDITVHKGVLKLEQLAEGSVSISPSVVVVDSRGAVIRDELPFDVVMDVDISINDRLEVTGSLMETLLGGELKLKQMPGRPLQLFGNLSTKGGEFYFYQTQLRIKRGNISFVGPPENPTVDVRAERKINNAGVTVGLRVRGPLQDNLQLDIYSEPAMSQAEATSYLVRGRGLDAGAGSDGTAMALMLAGGVVNQSTLVSELNRVPGISNLEFGATESDGDTAATVSGYIGERLYLSYGVGLYEPISVLTARLYLRSRLWLEVVSRLENSVDIYYSFDIN